MPLFDLPLDDLRLYRPARDEPDDFDAFWQRTLDEARARALPPHFEPHDAALSTVTVENCVFSGWGGHRIRAWVLLPTTAGKGPHPCVISYLGYNNGRGMPYEHLVWPAAGWAALIMDTRGQGAVNCRTAGATPDPYGGTHAEGNGFVTRGLLDPETYYYRRVITDAVLAVDTAAAHPAIDASRLVVRGESQGGGIATAVAALYPGVRAALVDTPFLSHFRRAVILTDRNPYREIADFLATQHGAEDQAFRTLSYVDGVNFAARTDVPVLHSVGLMDATCPPSTVFAAHNHWKGPKRIKVYPWNDHEGGAAHHSEVQLRYLKTL
ncbi:cephalosporin-C deacetylase [Actinacidiphila alni]|uniref:Cephalosporin-C deacetylase n=1 Tax=Actinacidiphila alni TaxID=380248 RepID=A0A1I2LE46_9ACTN|nr:acetylxylan esterase [Actinacidiphila alni]SFF75747.1 cephalosporin-C deacetylase [Actinacidiphila alni]